MKRSVLWIGALMMSSATAYAGLLGGKSGRCFGVSFDGECLTTLNAEDFFDDIVPTGWEYADFEDCDGEEGCVQLTIEKYPWQRTYKLYEASCTVAPATKEVEPYTCWGGYQATAKNRVKQLSVTTQNEPDAGGRPIDWVNSREWVYTGDDFSWDRSITVTSGVGLDRNYGNSSGWYFCEKSRGVDSDGTELWDEQICSFAIPSGGGSTCESVGDCCREYAGSKGAEFAARSEADYQDCILHLGPTALQCQQLLAGREVQLKQAKNAAYQYCVFNPEKLFPDKFTASDGWDDEPLESPTPGESCNYRGKQTLPFTDSKEDGDSRTCTVEALIECSGVYPNCNCETLYVDESTVDCDDWD